MSYKEEHELFTSNVDGTSVMDIAVVVSTAPVVYLLRNLILHSIFTPAVTRSKLTCFLLDFSVLILPIVLSFTVFADYIQVFLTVLLCASAFIVTFQEQFKQNAEKNRKGNTLHSILEQPVPGDKRPFITAYRAYVNIATAVSILAVDFVIFPRRYSKTETYGTGLMDVGVGAFIVSNAVVSPEARGKLDQQRSVSRKLSSVVNAIKGSSPLLILGMGRMLAVKGIDYQEHVAEYGVHWNFFFTLAAVKILSTIVLCFMAPSRSGLLSILMMCSYEYFLTGKGLREFIVLGFDGKDSREGLLNANREGIFSCFGYLSLYFVGVQFGRYLFSQRGKIKDWINLLLVLLVATPVCYLLLMFTEVNIDMISRRMANLSYVIWMIAYNLQTLTSFLFVDVFVYVCTELCVIQAPRVSSGVHHKKYDLLDAVNRNGLLYFLLANVLTGVVNMSIQTIYASPQLAVTVLVVYMFILCATVFVLHAKNISTKFW